jgi:hypothetical protein
MGPSREKSDQFLGEFQASCHRILDGLIPFFSGPSYFTVLFFSSVDFIIFLHNVVLQHHVALNSLPMHSLPSPVQLYIKSFKIQNLLYFFKNFLSPSFLLNLCPQSSYYFPSFSSCFLLHLYLHSYTGAGIA